MRARVLLHGGMESQHGWVLREKPFVKAQKFVTKTARNIRINIGQELKMKGVAIPID